MRSPRCRYRPILTLATFWLVAAPGVQAAEEAALGSAPSWHPANLLEAVVSSVIFGLVGIVLAMAGFKLFDLITPFNLEKEMCENKNIAVGILCAAIVLGICHIIAASMS